ncbi:glycoside hydrolase family 25 protein [Hymenobacter sp. BT683]|uniref:Glycoside hydrolase family 25 protein n=1 Tax=Hymenobacter jeongseonensis TaxID=2791027 RepID=A0ABS0IDX4_9BACT|nr:glycoside hydrolase family 25 protein [Hymenobacter jeongseonensis]MBF9236168.1 glycoside hydrolase family 25 protein [Hymenobacter jeongseonensis]
MPASRLTRQPAKPAPRSVRRRQWRRGVLALLLLGLVLGLTYYLRHRVQVNRYARRTWATLTKGGLTGREKTPLLAGYSVHGIDVSAYQGRIDWPEVARHGVRFAFIKATEGGTMRDARFARNWREARKAGVLCGAYHYFQPKRDGKLQADLFARTVPIGPGDLPPVLDIEAPNFHDVAVLRREVGRWLRLMEAHYGVRPILYSNYSYYKRYLAGHFDDYPLWLAHYEVERPSMPANKWIIWQHSDEAYVPGIRGVVDFNVFQGNFKALQALRVPAATARQPKAAKVPQGKPTSPSR